MKRIILILILELIMLSLIMLVSSCRKQTDDGFDKFIVKAGENECNGFRFHLYSRESLDFEFKVNSTWVWEDIIPAGVNGVSKICGFAESFDHKENRIVLGVKYISGDIRLYGYGDANGVPFNGFICNVEVGGIYFCRMAIEGGYYVIRVNGCEYKHPRGSLHKIGVRLNPYVGGEYVLGHDWIVELKFYK